MHNERVLQWKEDAVGRQQSARCSSCMDVESRVVGERLGAGSLPESDDDEQQRARTWP